MKYIHILKELYCRPVSMMPTTFKVCHDLIQSRLEHKPAKFFGLVKPSMKLMEDNDDELPDESSDNNTYDVIGSTAYIDVLGPIGKRLGWLEKSCGATDIMDIKSYTLDAMTNPNIKTVVYSFDSGGGSVAGIPETADIIAECGRKKKTLAYIDGMCASAAYWLASATNEIYATPSSDIGGIGVYVYLLDSSKAYEKEGLEPRLVKAGENKGEFLPGLPITKEMLDNLQVEVDAIYKQFTGFVGQRRPSIRNEYMQGRTYLSNVALENGFIDITVKSIDEILIQDNLVNHIQ